MKILNIENAVKYELSQRAYIRLSRTHKKNLKESENEILLTGKTLKERGTIVHELIVLYAAEIAESFKDADLESRTDFRLLIVPRLITSQMSLEGLSIDPDDQNSYWNLIDTLGEVVSFKSRTMPVTAQCSKEI